MYLELSYLDGTSFDIAYSLFSSLLLSYTYNYVYSPFPRLRYPTITKNVIPHAFIQKGRLWALESSVSYLLTSRKPS